jgi:hypothetical protein
MRNTFSNRMVNIDSSVEVPAVCHVPLASIADFTIFDITPMSNIQVYF